MVALVLVDPGLISRGNGLTGLIFANVVGLGSFFRLRLFLNEKRFRAYFFLHLDNLVKSRGLFTLPGLASGLGYIIVMAGRPIYMEKILLDSVFRYIIFNSWLLKLVEFIQTGSANNRLIIINQLTILHPRTIVV